LAFWFRENDVEFKLFCLPFSWTGLNAMKDHNRVFDQGQIFVPSGPTPRPSVIFLSVLAHLIALGWIVESRHSPIVLIVPKEYAVQKISGAHLSFNASKVNPTPPHILPLRARRSARHALPPQSGTTADGAALQVLREHAKQATTAMVTSIKQRQIYGFSPIEYRLAVQMAGEIPTISAADVPPHFEQYVVVEITIDVDGRVADARIVAGQVDSTIQQTLLSAIRGFKYNPAKRDGTPIPSQLDLVIHIPT
jgi:TonB family protein